MAAAHFLEQNLPRTIVEDIDAKHDDGEWMLAPNPNRFVIHPVEHKDLWDMYKKQVASFWTTEEVDISGDFSDLQSMTSDEQYFILHILAFFAASDGVVIENLGKMFLDRIEVPEIRAFYSLQMAMENVHSDVYSLLIMTYVRDPSKQQRLLHATQHFPAIAEKNQWALKWVTGRVSFAVRLLAFAAVEGIFFSGSFCSLFWLKKRGKMSGLTFSNELISRDEGMHVDFAVMLYNKLSRKLSEETVFALIEDAVSVEKRFVSESLPVAMIGMNATLMCQYIEFVADRLLVSLGYPKRFRAVNPFEWMTMQSLQGKTNFFEKRVGEYQKAGVMVANSVDNHTFTTDAAF